MSPSHAAALRWRPVADASDHPLTPLDRQDVGQDVRLIAELGPRDRFGAERFRLFLESGDLGRTAQPIATGLARLDSGVGPPWIEVTRYQSHLLLEDGRAVDVPDGIALRLIEALVGILTAGGSLAFEYESPGQAITAQALAAGVPAIATPLGGMLLASGCSAAFRDRAGAPGGRSGPRRLQGFRPAGAAHEEQRQYAALVELEAFMNRSKDLDWQVQSQIRPIAEATITALRAQLAVPEGPLIPR